MSDDELEEDAKIITNLNTILIGFLGVILIFLLERGVSGSDFGSLMNYIVLSLIAFILSTLVVFFRRLSQKDEWKKTYVATAGTITIIGLMTLATAFINYALSELPELIPTLIGWTIIFVVVFLFYRFCLFRKKV